MERQTEEKRRNLDRKLKKKSKGGRDFSVLIHFIAGFLFFLFKI